VVVVKTLSKIVFIAALLFLIFLMWFILQMGAPLLSYILSFLSVVCVIILPNIIKNRRHRALAIGGLSIIINANLLFYNIITGSVTGIFTYGVGMLVVTWLALFLLSETVITLPAKRAASENHNSAALPDEMDS
jgi:hypothetical protein